MANPEHLDLLRQGVSVWNKWRQNYLSSPHPDLTGVDLSGKDLDGIDFNNVILSNATLRKTSLMNANLDNAAMRHTNFEDANLEDAHLGSAVLAGANMRSACLNGADMIWAFLEDTILQGADLGHAGLMQVFASRADFRQANLSGANMRKAQLRCANLSEANLSLADLSEADLSQANLSGANIERVTMVQTFLEQARLDHCLVYGISAWDIQGTPESQSKLRITRTEDARIEVDDLEVAQFIYLLLNRSKLRNVITTLGERAVLILGRFGERKHILDVMATQLRIRGYLPIMFDFERPTDRDLTETIRILAGLSLFVIADITNPRAVPLEIASTVPDYMVPFVTIIQRGEPAFGMFDDLPRKYHWALPLLEYNDETTLTAAFDSKVVQPALEKLVEVRRQKALPPIRRSAEE